MNDPAPAAARYGFAEPCHPAVMLARFEAVRRHAGHFSPRRVGERLLERKLNRRIRGLKRRVRAGFPRSR